MAKKIVSSKGNRKSGRNAKKPSQQRYTSERRWEKNKRKSAQKEANKTGKPVQIKIDGNYILISPI